MKKICSYESFLVLMVAAFSSFGPFVTDMYLPAFPQLQEFFHTDASAIQLSLSASMIGLAIGQIFIGPISDKFGRKPLAISSMLLFVISTIACILASSIEFFVGFRFLQGVGGAGGIVLSKSIAADRYCGEQLTKIMAVIGALSSVSPVAAPVAGGFVASGSGWEGVFFVLLAVGAVLLAGSFAFRETLPPDKRLNGGVIRTFSSFRKIVRNKSFLSISLQYGFCGGTFFAYIASSPFIIQEHFGFSTMDFSYIFGINALFIVAGAMASPKFRTPASCTHFGSIGILAVCMAACIALFVSVSFWLYELLSVIMLFCIGLCFASSAVIGLEEEHENAGAASAFIGSALFIAGGIVSPLVGMGDIMHSTAIAYLICATGTAVYDIRYRKTGRF